MHSQYTKDLIPHPGYATVQLLLTLTTITDSEVIIQYIHIEVITHEAIVQAWAVSPEVAFI